MLKELIAGFFRDYNTYPITVITIAILGAVWATEIHFTTSTVSANVERLGNDLNREANTLRTELITQQQSTNQLLLDISQRLSHIEGKLSR